MFSDYSSKAFEEKYTYHGNDLGALWQIDHTDFRVWSPTADAVNVLLYESGTPRFEEPLLSIPMVPDENGTWVASAQGDLNGIYYTYSVSHKGSRAECCDPYARAAGVNGKRAMIVRLSDTDPLGWDADTSPALSGRYTDYVIYELHVRDLSVNEASGISGKGTFLAFTESDTVTASGYPSGLDHIRRLGVTHVHLLPVYDYGSVDEARPQKKEYNWGYDPVNFNVPEGSYSTNPFDGFTRIREMKQMILSMHRCGISVIMDVVYNHVYHTFEFSMNQTVPGYFSRQSADGKLSNGSFCGNDTASERSMVRKFIVDSVNYWADEYHIDGFRFDLVGLLDVETIREIIRTVRLKHPHVMFYGEGWDMPTDLTKNDVMLAIQRNAALIPEFAFFNDTIRDTVRGSVFDVHLAGYASGLEIPKETVFDCFCGRVSWSDSPEQVVNYVSCHDNHTLHDRIAEALPNAGEQEIARRCRLAAAFNLLSVGIPFFQAGEEMLRSKRNAAGKYVGNSYCSDDSVNELKWSNRGDPEVNKTVEYYRGLLRIRKSHPMFRLSDPAEIRSHIRMPKDTPAAVNAIVLSGHETILVLYNPTAKTAPVTLPRGIWDVLVFDDTASDSPLLSVSSEIMIPPISAAVMVQRP